MDGVDVTVGEQSDPEIPVPVETGLEEAAYDGPDDVATDEGEYDEGNGVLIGRRHSTC